MHLLARGLVLLMSDEKPGNSNSVSVFVLQKKE